MTDGGVRPYRPDAQPLGEVLSGLMRHVRFRSRDRTSALSSAWVSAVGPGIAAQARVRRFHNGELLVEVDSSALLHELNGFLADQLLEALQASRESRDVARIRFCLAAGRPPDG